MLRTNEPNLKRTRRSSSPLSRHSSEWSPTTVVVTMEEMKIMDRNMRPIHTTHWNDWTKPSTRFSRLFTYLTMRQDTKMRMTRHKRIMRRAKSLPVKCFHDMVETIPESSTPVTLTNTTERSKMFHSFSWFVKNAHLNAHMRTSASNRKKERKQTSYICPSSQSGWSTCQAISSKFATTTQMTMAVHSCDLTRVCNLDSGPPAESFSSAAESSESGAAVSSLLAT
mmetsp:Transcript_92097/g.214053  ORF Transcript_92097/g.214053 Transcript_92097/m.214053 type:complete len:225 (+) Transcript_92097:710-1384(+)